jgi:hypothetical protein
MCEYESKVACFSPLPLVPVLRAMADSGARHHLAKVGSGNQEKCENLTGISDSLPLLYPA